LPLAPAICTSIDYAIPFDAMMRMIRGAGFEAVGLGGRLGHAGYETPEGTERIKALADALGMAVVSVHAPFPEGDQLCSLDENRRLESVRLCKAALDAAKRLDAGNVVVHLARPLPDPAEQERALAKGFESVRALADRASDRGVLLALENGMGAYNQTLFRFMDEFAAEPVVFCYDSGHENVDRSGTSVIERFGARLRIVHMHDNTGRDTHALPFEGDTDWPRVMGALGGLGYANAMLLEASMKESAFKEPEVFLAEARKRAERLTALARNAAPRR